MKITKNKRGYKIDLNQFELDALEFVATHIGGRNEARWVFSDRPDSLLRQYWNLMGNFTAGTKFKTADDKHAIYIDLEDSEESVPVKSKKCKVYNRDESGRFCRKQDENSEFSCGYW